MQPVVWDLTFQDQQVCNVFVSSKVQQILNVPSSLLAVSGVTSHRLHGYFDPARFNPPSERAVFPSSMELNVLH